MLRFNFDKFIRLGFLVIIIILNCFLYAVNHQLDENAKKADGGRSLVCLELKAMDQPVKQYAPCMSSSVYKLWKDQPVKPVASHDMICEIVKVIQRPIQECESP